MKLEQTAKDARARRAGCGCIWTRPKGLNRGFVHVKISILHQVVNRSCLWSYCCKFLCRRGAGRDAQHQMTSDANPRSIRADTAHSTRHDTRNLHPSSCTPSQNRLQTLLAYIRSRAPTESHPTKQSPDYHGPYVKIIIMPIGQQESGVTSGVKFVTSTLGNTVGGLTNTVGGTVGALGRLGFLMLTRAIAVLI